jgi:hypothetical protein
MDKSLLEPKRRLPIDRSEIYFRRATINNWHRLPEKDENKYVIVESLRYMGEEGKAEGLPGGKLPNYIYISCLNTSIYVKTNAVIHHHLFSCSPCYRTNKKRFRCQ